MANLPKVVSLAWDNREGPAVLATADIQGGPNVIYVGAVKKYSEDTLVVANNYFNKTQANILTGSRGALLFITKEGKAYQVKGTLEYYSDGPIFDDMKQWNSPERPGHGVAVLRVEQVFSGPERIL